MSGAITASSVFYTIGSIAAAASMAKMGHDINREMNADDPEFPDPGPNATESEREAYNAARSSRKRNQAKQRMTGSSGREGTILTGNQLGGGAPGGGPQTPKTLLGE